MLLIHNTTQRNKTQHIRSHTRSPGQLKEEITVTADKKTSYLTWVGLGLMSVQFGVLARLTWWEYSWDIMVSYSCLLFTESLPREYVYQCAQLITFNLLFHSFTHCDSGTSYLFRYLWNCDGCIRLLLFN